MNTQKYSDMILVSVEDDALDLSDCLDLSDSLDDSDIDYCSDSINQMNL